MWGHPTPAQKSASAHTKETKQSSFGITAAVSADSCEFSSMIAFAKRRSSTNVHDFSSKSWNADFSHLTRPTNHTGTKLNPHRHCSKFSPFELHSNGLHGSSIQPALWLLHMQTRHPSVSRLGSSLQEAPPGWRPSTDLAQTLHSPVGTTFPPFRSQEFHFTTCMDLRMLPYNRSLERSSPYVPTNRSHSTSLRQGLSFSGLWLHEVGQRQRRSVQLLCAARGRQ